MKKGNFWSVALAVALLLVGTQMAQAGSVGDGAYVGGSGGFGTAVIDASSSSNHTSSGANAVDNFNLTDGGIGMDGASYGAFMGYGFRMGSLFVGAEVDGHWSDMKFDPGTISVQEGGAGSGSATRTVTSASAELAFTAGVAGRLGYYVNPTTLFSVNGGLVGSQFDVSWGSQAEEYWDPGARYGVALESTLFDGVAVRLDWSITDYYNAEVFGIGSVTEKPGNLSVEIQPTMSVAHLGLVYTF